MEKNSLLQYMRDADRNKVGVLIGLDSRFFAFDDLPTNMIIMSYGWSLCNKKDTFDLELGKHIAIERAYKSMYEIFCHYTYLDLKTAEQNRQITLAPIPAVFYDVRPIPFSRIFEINLFSERCLRYFGKNVDFNQMHVKTNFDQYSLKNLEK